MNIQTKRFVSCLFLYSLIAGYFVKAYSWQINVDPARGEAGKAAAYLKTGVSARVLSLGNAFVGLADDGTAAYWNPAGLSSLENKELNLMYTKMSLDRTFNFANFVFPVGNLGVFSISGINTGVSDIQGYDSSDHETEKFNYSANAILLSGGRTVSDEISCGANIKLMFESLKDSSAIGYSLDFGLLVMLTNKLSLGVMLNDIYGRLHWKTDHTDMVDFSTKLGLAYKLLNGKVILLGDIEKFAARDVLKTHIGSELKLIEYVTLRVGLNEKSLTAGTGFNLPVGKMRISLDYAFSADKLKVGDTHRVSLTVKF